MGLDFEALWSRWMLTIADAQLEDSGSASASENYKKIFFRDINMLTIAQNIEVKNIWLQVHICVN